MTPRDFYIGIDWWCMPLSRVWCEALPSWWGNGTCLSFNFKGIDRGGESYGRCDRRYVMAERRIGGDEDGRHRFLLCVKCLVSSSNSLGKRG
jgi:hypothetical protein